jgi:hypothetical protein
MAPEVGCSSLAVEPNAEAAVFAAEPNAASTYHFHEEHLDQFQFHFLVLTMICPSFKGWYHLRRVSDLYVRPEPLLLASHVPLSSRTEHISTEKIKRHRGRKQRKIRIESAFTLPIHKAQIVREALRSLVCRRCCRPVPLGK